jgi:hypothetical protein
MLISTVKTLTVIITDSSSSYGHCLTLKVLVHSGILTPKTDSNTQSAFISQNNISPVFHRSSLLYVNLRELPNLLYHTNDVNGPHLLKHIDVRDGIKAKTLRLNTVIILHQLNGTIFIKNDAIVILY